MGSIGLFYLCPGFCLAVLFIIHARSVISSMYSYIPSSFAGRPFRRDTDFCFCMPIRIPQIQVDPLGRYLIIDELANVVDIRTRAAGVACIRRRELKPMRLSVFRLQLRRNEVFTLSHSSHTEDSHMSAV